MELLDKINSDGGKESIHLPIERHEYNNKFLGMSQAAFVRFA